MRGPIQASFWRSSRGVAVIAAIGTFLIHLIGNPHYGFFRDELYFIICGFHPQWGYVDQPPVVPLLAAGTQLFGHSLVLLRAVPALFAAAGAYVTCMLVAEFGGGIFAQSIAAIVFFFSPVLMSFGMKVGPDEVGLWLWPLIALFVVRLAHGADPRLWLLIGLCAGVCLVSKYSVLFFLVALVIGLLLTPQRRIFASWWCVAAAAIAFLIALPNFLWQMHYGFPMLELLRAGQTGKNLIVGPGTYLFQELVITNVVLALEWVIGLIWLLAMRQFRFLGYLYVILIVEMLLFHGKHYYPADVYPILIVAGAVPIESWTKGRRIARAVVVAAVLIFGLIFTPFTLPILPERTFIAYAKAVSATFHISQRATATEHHREDAALPGDWADMHGWPELAQTVKRIYDALPPGERAQAAAVASNYGEASAIKFFAPEVPVISGHNQYWLWGYDHYSGNVIIDVAGDCGAKGHLFRNARRAAVFSAPYVTSYEDRLPIMLCRGIRKPLSKIWPEVKSYE